jgi:NACalpha-BTF3-like transcription factor
MHIKQEEAEMLQSKKEEEKKADPELINDSKIRSLMEMTLKSRKEVIDALKACDWNTESALINFLMIEDI